MHASGANSALPLSTRNTHSSCSSERSDQARAIKSATCGASTSRATGSMYLQQNTSPDHAYSKAFVRLELLPVD